MKVLEKWTVICIWSYIFLVSEKLARNCISSRESQVITQWIMDQVPLGNKRPRLGMARLVHCPACRGILETPLLLSSGHVLLNCIAVEGISYTLPNIFNCWLGTRIREGIRDFAVDCSNAGRSAASTHYLYVNGMSPVGEPIKTKEHLQRGKSLDNLTKMWLFTWGQDHID